MDRSEILRFGTVRVWGILAKRLNSLPNDKIIDMSKLKAFADNKTDMIEKLKFVLGSIGNIVGKGERKHCGKRKKCWLPAFSPFPIMFSNSFYF